MESPIPPCTHGEFEGDFKILNVDFKIVRRLQILESPTPLPMGKAKFECGTKAKFWSLPPRLPPSTKAKFECGFKIVSEAPKFEASSRTTIQHWVCALLPSGGIGGRNSTPLYGLRKTLAAYSSALGETLTGEGAPQLQAGTGGARSSGLEKTLGRRGPCASGHGKGLQPGSVCHYARASLYG